MKSHSPFFRTNSLGILPALTYFLPSKYLFLPWLLYLKYSWYFILAYLSYLPIYHQIIQHHASYVYLGTWKLKEYFASASSVLCLRLRTSATPQDNIGWTQGLSPVPRDGNNKPPKFFTSIKLKSVKNKTSHKMRIKVSYHGKICLIKKKSFPYLLIKKKIERFFHSSQIMHHLNLKYSLSIALTLSFLFAIYSSFK